MEAEVSVSKALDDFVTATVSAGEGVPDATELFASENGITLLDTKNDIFLSYLQALALRNLHVIRSVKEGIDADVARRTSHEITKNLIEQRVYLERGVRPIEQKIKYQVDRVLKLADDEERARVRSSKPSARSSGRTRAGATRDGGSADSSSAEEDDGDSDSDDDDGGDSEGSATLDMDSSSFKPNPGLMAAALTNEVGNTQGATGAPDGVYRPPRISATSMPEPDRRERAERRPNRSRTLDEYVSTEISAAPLAEPSIGSNIALGGRRNKSARQLAQEKERRDYEETNLVRLPKESKKDRAKKGLRGREAAGGYGGEDWRDLGETVDRIGSLTRKKTKDSALDRSRKRRATEDGPRDTGIGSAFDVKKRRLMKKR